MGRPPRSSTFDPETQNSTRWRRQASSSSTVQKPESTRSETGPWPAVIGGCPAGWGALATEALPPTQSLA